MLTRRGIREYTLLFRMIALLLVMNKIIPEFYEAILLDSMPDLPHKVKIKIEIMLCIQARGKNFTRLE